MGRSVTPKYAVQYTVAGGRFGLTSAAWRGDQEGRPTAANLKKHVEGYNASFLPGGVNAHCGPLVITGARIVRNVAGGAVVAEYSAVAQ